MKSACSAVLLLALCAFGQIPNDNTDIQELLSKGDTALAENRLHDAAEAFQKAVDRNPSSFKAHEGLGTALSREIMAGTVRPSADSDVIERIETHLHQASDLAPSAPSPVLALSQLETVLAERSTDPDEKAQRYQTAQELLKRAIALDWNKPELYLSLASLERDQFGPPIQDARTRFNKSKGPLPDTKLRHSLQQQWSALIDDAVANAQTAWQMNSSSAKPLILMARLLRDRAAIRETLDLYLMDLRSAGDWQRQFLAVGGHLGEGEMADH